MHRLLLALALALLTLACSSQPSPANAPPDGILADDVDPPRGVPDDGAHPGVVAIAVGTSGLCSGALVAPDVVLTARHCVSMTETVVTCPRAAGDEQITGDRPAATLHILVGESVETASWRASGSALVLPPADGLCDADIALILLDTPIDGVPTLGVRGTLAAKGERVTAVGFGRARDGATPGVKLVRDHVLVREAGNGEFTVGEATCQGDSGGPALDQATGEIVGVVSRGGATCDGPSAHNIYTQAPAYRGLIDDAIARGRARVTVNAPSGSGKGRGFSDVGAACARGGDCAAGVCVTQGDARYCSRACDPEDRCPSNYRCARAENGVNVCAER
jgi:hypothetical protein